MARKGNPISVRLDLNRSSDSSRFKRIWVLLFFLFTDYCIGKKIDCFLGSQGLFMILGCGINVLLQRLCWPFPSFIIHYMTGAPGDAPFDLNQPDAAATEEHGDPGGTSRNEASSSSVSTSSEDSSSVDQASGSREKSALDQRKEELIMENLQERKGDLADDQRVSDVRKAVEADFDVSTKADEFELIEEMKKEAGAKKEDCPATNSAFHGIREYQGHVQDGRGGGKPNDCSNREGGKTHE